MVDRQLGLYVHRPLPHPSSSSLLSLPFFLSLSLSVLCLSLFFSRNHVLFLFCRDLFGSVGEALGLGIHYCFSIAAHETCVAYESSYHIDKGKPIKDD